jgi:hypothetical protein
MQVPPPTDQAEAPIPPETGSNDPIPPETVSNDENMNLTVKVRRKAANRTEPLYLRRGTRPRQLPGYYASPPQDEDIPAVARKKPRLEEPLPATIDEAAIKKVLPDVSAGIPPPATDNDDDVNADADAVSDTQPNALATGSWTLEEDAKLTRALTNTSKKKYGKGYKTNWAAVAALVSSRTKLQCCNRWHNALDSNIDRANGRSSNWTAVEDSKLKDAVQTHGGTSWVAISALIPGRTNIQCYNRWRIALGSSIDPTMARVGRWTADEDSTLKDAVQTHDGKNWGAIAALVPGRTIGQCRNRWHTILGSSIDPTMARVGRWTADEDSTLKDAVQTHGAKNWDAIAVLVPGRTNSQCHYRWNNALDPSIDRANERAGKWTEDEDSKLKDAVQTHGGNNWKEIAVLVPGRTKRQCSTRWRDALNPSIGRANGRTGKWTPVEDSKLKDAVQTYGSKNWGTISALVPSRTKKQCRDRWHDALANGRTGKWTPVEDIKLKDAVQMHGEKDWAAIASLVPGRVEKQCHKRWHVLGRRSKQE